ncbi:MULTISPECIES: DUF6543 domain-containing protein [unclassified Pseudomonas]|uniref:dermonecrotic toxin domain-containing protein n=1 Tax=unclassified Pseudomonas TaxID=196821 RepID=UPI002448CB72|nr:MULTISPECIES: DUF6543 domain-containing protein [unclassified Pseudomonas]MDH0301148.1 hypothetical protein [Pseudomonas sp. GD04091]MDH1986597.1 hypothetical protein [Pseudomonas sp. GD03689]
MSTIKERVERSLDALDAGRPLASLVDEIIGAYPDPYELARQHAQRILSRHTGRAMDPRFVWWHQFDRASTSNRSFTGWWHSGSPSKSMHLAELVVQRFDARFQQAPDELDLYGGFYRQGHHASAFDERNEVPMLGSAVQQDLWALDFAVAYRAELASFWSTYGDKFRVLAKINLLGQAHAARRDGRITVDDWTRLRAMVSHELSVTGVPTLDMLQRDSTANPLVASRYAIDRVDRGCLYSFAAQDGRVVLYRPWAAEALKGFESELTMARWLREQLQDADTLGTFTRAAHVDARDSVRTHEVKATLQSIANSRSEQAAVVVLAYLRQPISGVLFTYLGDRANEEMRQNASTMLDNADLRKAMWSGYLAAFLRVFGGFAPLGWPMTLTLLGASVAKVALDVDAAASAVDDHARRAALRDAIFDSLFAALNMADLGFQSSLVSLTYEAPFNERSTSLADWTPAQSVAPALQDLEANQVLAGETELAGRLRGMRLDESGGCWIVLDGLSYRVRYSHELAVWLIVPPDDPFAFAPLHPVRLDENGVWRLLQPPRLAGGSPPAVEGMASVTSRFWASHVTLDEVSSRVLSANALHRQKALLRQWPVAELAPGAVPALDGHGLDCVLTAGATHYSYRHGRDYFNSLIEYYTSDESRVNDVFRSGTYRYGDEDDYIKDLADSLEQLPRSNKVSLYRGGHSSRGTGGERYRGGQLKVGDVLVNTDIASFTENPYKVGEFASTHRTQAPQGLVGVFDDSSIIYELPAGSYQDGTPISPFSLYWDEGETVFLPGRYFRVDKLEQVYGEHFRFIHVTLSQVVGPVSGPVYDLRTGQAFDRASFVARIKTPTLAQRFFPSAAEPASSLLEQ